MAKPKRQIVQPRRDGPPLLHPSISELALHIGITPPVLCQCIRKGQPCRGVRYYYREDWTGEKPVPAVYPAAAPTPQKRSGGVYRLKDAPPRPKVERGPDLQGVEGGLVNSKEMVAFMRECREELREVLPAVLYKELRERRRRSEDGRALTLSFVLCLPRSAVFQRDRDVLMRRGWAEGCAEDERYVDFVKAREFDVEGLEHAYNG